MGTSTDDDQDGDIIDASCFTAGDKVAIQAWFGSYIFTDKSGRTASGPTFPPAEALEVTSGYFRFIERK